MITITKVQVHLHKYSETSQIKAFADIIIDEEFIVRNLIVKKREDGVTVVNMPNKERKDHTRQDIAHPITEDCRQYIEDEVLDEYEKVINTIEGSLK